ncbi:hypothetical protein [Bacillus salipaludis]|uniref:Uncharacterized protein n=1 Tax=Bacillus salipaludis TaxID=2547811 RepID=A0ABW8RK65_9BACI
MDTFSHIVIGLGIGALAQIDPVVSENQTLSNSRMDQSISDFLACTTYAYPFVDVRKDGYFIYWKDLRFRTKKFFPYLAIQFISSDFKRKNSYIGKVISLKHYKKVIRSLANSSFK